VKSEKLEANDAPMFYRPVSQQSSLSFSFLVRTRADLPTAKIGQDITRAVQSVDSNLPVFNVRTIDDVLLRAEAQRRFAMLLLAVFAGIALTLAAVGVYGVVSYAVGQRTREIGIRLALGARRTEILRLVLGQGLVLAGAGVGAGIVGSFLLTRLLRDLLFGVTATDWLTYCVAPLLLAVIALLSTWWPARRASRVDPLIALRYE
jgi:ABC-type antimicrobial peptide transport system permease subunit